MNGPSYRYLVGEQLREAELRNVQYFARVSSREVRQEGAGGGDEDVQERDDDHYGLCRLGAATARHTRRWTRPIVTSSQFVDCARLVDDEAQDTRRAERQQTDDDHEGEPEQALILALDRGWARGASCRRPLPGKRRTGSRDRCTTRPLTTAQRMEPAGPTSAATRLRCGQVGMCCMGQRRCGVQSMVEQAIGRLGVGGVIFGTGQRKSRAPSPARGAKETLFNPLSAPRWRPFFELED